MHLPFKMLHKYFLPFLLVFPEFCTYCTIRHITYTTTPLFCNVSGHFGKLSNYVNQFKFCIVIFNFTAHLLIAQQIAQKRANYRQMAACAIESIRNLSPLFPDSALLFLRQRRIIHHFNFRIANSEFLCYNHQKLLY